jgi:hypothetical protein
MSNSTAQNQQENSEVQKFVTPQTFKLKNFGLSPVIEKYCSKAQYQAFPKYKYSKDAKEGETLIVATDKIKVTKGGIPKLDGEYRKSDKDRGFFWLGCDNEQPELVALFDMLRSIDEEFSESLKNNKDSSTLYILKDKQKEPIDKLEYVPIVRESAQPEDKKGDKEYEPYDRIKVKFSTKYDQNAEEGDLQEIDTTLYLLDNEEPEPYTTVTDFTKSLKWNCEARFVFAINKFWAMKAVKNKKRECGFSIKCLQIIITQESTSGGGVSQAEKFKKRLFAPTGTGVKKVEASKDKEEKSDEKSDEKPATKGKAKQAKSESESSEEESEEEAPKKKIETKKQSKKSESEESEESEDEAPKKKVQAKSSKKKQESSEESDSDSSEDEQATKKKVAKK